MREILNLSIACAVSVLFYTIGDTLLSDPHLGFSKAELKFFGGIVFVIVWWMVRNIGKASKYSEKSGSESSNLNCQESLDENLMEELRFDMEERETKELEDIWEKRQNLNPKYYIETYKIIQEILIERGKLEDVQKCCNHSEKEAFARCIFCGRDLCIHCSKKTKKRDYCCKNNDSCLSHQNYH